MAPTLSTTEKVRALMQRAEVAAALGPLTNAVLADLERLKRSLQISEGDILMYERDRLARFLSQQFDVLLEDNEVTPAEDLYQASLQDVFDIGFDDYLVLIRPSLAASWRRIDTAAELGTRPDRYTLEKRRETLRTLCRLAGVPGA
jgi:hypothetical protein